MDHVRAYIAIASLIVSGTASAQSPRSSTAGTPLQAAAAQAPHIVTFDAPGAATSVSSACGRFCGTVPLQSINDSGTVVGFYTDPQVVPHGFLRSADGRFTVFDAPGAGLGAGLYQGTTPNGINNRGEIAGELQDSSYAFRSFVRHVDGSFTVFDAPGAGTGPYQGTLAAAINDTGMTAGVYIDGNNVYHGFVRSHDGFASFDPPGSIFTGVFNGEALNDSGVVTGYYLDANNVSHGFCERRTAPSRYSTPRAPERVPIPARSPKPSPAMVRLPDYQ